MDLSIPVPSSGALFNKQIKVSTGTMWAIFCVAAASFLPLLFLQYVGEEAVYAIIAQEMAANKPRCERRSKVVRMSLAARCKRRSKIPQ